MLPYDAKVWEALRTHQEGAVHGIASYQGRQVRVEVDSGSLTFAGDARVQASGSVRVSGVGPVSLVPKAKTDILAPNGQELALWRTVRVRSSSVVIPLGVYQITGGSDGVERLRGDVVKTWEFTVTLSDRFKPMQDDDFISVDGPVWGNAIWDEVRRLVPMPVQEALGSVPVPVGTVYESRIAAVETLIDLLTGAPHLTREGVLTARRRDAWLTVTTPAFDINGVIDWDDKITGDFINQVQVVSTRNPQIAAYAQLLDDSNPLSVGRAGGRTHKITDSGVETKAAARAIAVATLARLSSRRSRQVRVSCTPEALLLELGDVGWFRDPVSSRQVFGEVAGLTVSMDVTAPVDVTVIVAEGV